LEYLKDGLIPSSNTTHPDNNFYIDAVVRNAINTQNRFRALREEPIPMPHLYDGVYRGGVLSADVRDSDVPYIIASVTRGVDPVPIPEETEAAPSSPSLEVIDLTGDDDELEEYPYDEDDDDESEQRVPSSVQLSSEGCRSQQTLKRRRDDGDEDDDQSSSSTSDPANKPWCVEGIEVEHFINKCRRTNNYFDTSAPVRNAYYFARVLECEQISQAAQKLAELYKLPNLSEPQLDAANDLLTFIGDRWFSLSN